MTEHRVGAHHLAFDTLITAGWCASAPATSPTPAATPNGRPPTPRPWGTRGTSCRPASSRRGWRSTGDPVRALDVVDDLRAVVAFDTCRPYAERLLGGGDRGAGRLRAHGRRRARLITGLQPGPRTQLLRARHQHRSDAEIEVLLAERGMAWPTLERWQAEVVLHTRHHGATPSDELVELVTECGRSGWALPFLGLGPRVERLLQAIRLDEVHPGLARALAYIAPTSPVEHRRRRGPG